MRAHLVWTPLYPAHVLMTPLYPGAPQVKYNRMREYFGKVYSEPVGFSLITEFFLVCCGGYINGLTRPSQHKK